MSGDEELGEGGGIGDAGQTYESMVEVGEEQWKKFGGGEWEGRRRRDDVGCL